MSGEKISALILAAGRSSRMGDFKPLLPLGERTVIEHAIILFKTADVADILVVAGFEAERLTPILEKCGVNLVVNQDYDRGMFSSLQTGVQHLASSCEAFFVLPADHPFVKPATVLSLMSAFRGGKEKIYRPSCQGRRGHPPLIPATLVPAILSFNEPGGLRALLSEYQEQTVNLDLNDPGILMDLDTREEYAQAREQFQVKD